MATANQKVGSIYEVGIEGVGYMLADNPQRPVRRQTGVLDTQPPGSDDPLSERVGRYDMIGQSDWTGGEGQEMLDRPSSDATRYYYSEGVDPFSTPGRIRCLALMENFNADTWGEPRVVTIGTDIYVQTSATQLTHLGSLPDASPTEFTAVGAGSITDVAEDGTYWYTANNTGIRRNNSGADPGSDWSTVNASQIAFIGDRMAALTVDTPPAFTTLDTAGAEEVAGGHVTHPGALLRGVTGGDGYAWWGVRTGSGATTSHVHYWQVDSDPVNHGVALTLPPGERIVDLFFYLGNVFIKAVIVEGSDATVKIYRAVPSDGLLTPEVVVEFPIAAVVTAEGTFAGWGKYVAFGWQNMQEDDTHGIGVIDLETGGFARWYAAVGATDSTATAQVHAARYGQDFILTAGSTGGGLFGADDTGALVDGFLESSTSDLASTALKHLDEVTVTSLPLDGGIDVSYSLDGGANYTALATYDTADDTRHVTELSTAVSAPSFRLRVDLDATAGDGPVITGVIAKTHVTGITDEIIELPINCNDYIADIHKTPIAEDSGPNKGMVRYRALRALIGTKILFQDVDWKMTASTTLCEVVGVESTSWGVTEQSRNLTGVADHVAVVTLRRPFSA